MATLKPITSADKLRRGAWRAGNRAAGAGNRAKQGAENVFRNATSQKSSRMHGGWNEMGARYGSWKFGARGLGRVNKPDRQSSAMLGGTLGFGAGLSAGTAVHGAQTSHDTNVHGHLLEARANARYKNKQLSKAFRQPRPKLITDLGTAAGRMAAKDEKNSYRRWPKFSPVAAGAGAAAGATISYGSQAADARYNHKKLDRIYRSKKNQEALAQIKKQHAAALERYTPTKQERLKERGRRAGTEAGGTAGAYLGARVAGKYLNRAFKLPSAPIKSKRTLAMTGAAAGIGAAYGALGRQDKHQYRVVEKMDDPFGINKEWKHHGRGYTKKGAKDGKGGFIGNPKQYEKLKSKGFPKKVAAAITNKDSYDVKKSHGTSAFGVDHG